MKMLHKLLAALVFGAMVVPALEAGKKAQYKAQYKEDSEMHVQDKKDKDYKAKQAKDEKDYKAKQAKDEKAQTAKSS